MADKMTPKESMQHLGKILNPVIMQVEAAALSAGIALVVHDPDKVARKAMRILNLKVKRGATTVHAMSPDMGVVSFGHDYVTRKWLETPAPEDALKVFLISGGGSALLTLTFKDGQVIVKKESDMHLT